MAAFDGQNLSGKSPYVLFQNIATHRSDLEYQLKSGKIDDVLTLLSTQKDGNGVVVGLNTRSFGVENAESSFRRIWLSYYPVEYLSAISLSEGKPPIQQTGHISQTWSVGSGFSGFQIDENSNQTIVQMDTSFNQNWVGIDLVHKKLLKSVLISGWAQGWEIPKDTKVLVMFWPQILSWIGYGILIGGFALVIPTYNHFSKEKQKKHQVKQKIRDGLHGL